MALALLCSACTSIAADARSFDNTRWHVTSVNGRATPAQGEYQLAFQAGRVDARFGCNSLGGEYAVVGDTVTATQVISTMMACGDPADSFERAGKAILNAPMQASWASSQHIRFSNAAGAMELERRR